VLTLGGGVISEVLQANHLNEVNNERKITSFETSFVEAEWQLLMDLPMVEKNNRYPKKL
jgi:hypothetical protein